MLDWYVDFVLFLTKSDFHSPPTPTQQSPLIHTTPESYSETRVYLWEETPVLALSTHMQVPQCEPQIAQVVHHTVMVSVLLWCGLLDEQHLTELVKRGSSITGTTPALLEVVTEKAMAETWRWWRTDLLFVSTMPFPRAPSALSSLHWGDVGVAVVGHFYHHTSQFLLLHTYTSTTTTKK